MTLSIIIPCYNESGNIPLILERFARVINRNDIEVILVNNGSTDTSKEVLKRLVPSYKFARIVHVPVNKGYGFGIVSGLKQGKGTYLGWTHADLQTDPEDVIKALAIIERNNDNKNLYVKGHRKGRPFMDQLFTTGMGLYESVYLGVKLEDINAQPNIFHREFFNSWENPPHDFALDLYALYLAKKKRLKVIRFDVLFPERIHGSSSWNTGLSSKRKFIQRTLEYSSRLKKSLK